jgi:hypothetical protein
MTQVLYRLADGLVIEAGEFPTAPNDPTLAIATLTPTEAAKLRQAGEKKIDSATGVITVTPPAPPPATRPKNLSDLAADYSTAKGNYQTGTTAVGAANTQWTVAITNAQQIAALRAGTVYFNLDPTNYPADDHWEAAYWDAVNNQICCHSAPFRIHT